MMLIMIAVLPSAGMLVWQWSSAARGRRADRARVAAPGHAAAAGLRTGGGASPTRRSEADEAR
jgi:hypothetical protein